MVVLGNEIGKDLCEALKLPKNTKSFVLRVESGKIVTVECEYYPENGDFVTALAEFTLVRKPEAPLEPEPVQFDAWMRLRTEVEHARYQSRMKLLSACDAVEAAKLSLSRMRSLHLDLRGIQ